MTVTIMGQPGSGKEQVARAVHDLGPAARRGGAPFLRLRCAELDGDMGEATLFGAERRGSASVERLAGYVELAHNGTLYLDDVADLPLRAQIRFLRLLDARHFRPGGTANEVGFGARIMVGTTKPLPDLVREGRLHESFDLRIRGYPVRVPALVEHAEDIPELVASFVDPSQFDQAAHTWLSTRAWPGNIRQLKHLVLCATRMCEHRPIGVADFEALLRAWNDDLPARTREWVAGTVLDTLRDDGTTLAKFQQVLLAEALRRCNGNQSAAARLIGMDRRTFARALNHEPEDGDGEGSEPGRSGG
jgi:DNA-binding NtrC family response regulator